MPMISTIGRRSPGIRLLILTIYVVLIAGSLTMVYPFALMIAGSSKSAYDEVDRSLVPPFLTDDTELYRKHLQGLFNESLEVAQMVYHMEAQSFAAIETPRPLTAGQRSLVREWDGLIRSDKMPNHAYTIGYVNADISMGTVPHNLRLFRATLADRYDGDLSSLNADLGTTFKEWNTIIITREDLASRRSIVRHDGLGQAWAAFKQTVPHTQRYYFDLDGVYSQLFMRSRYANDLSDYNKQHGLTGDAALGSWAEVKLSQRLPADPAEQQDWEAFVRRYVNPVWLRVSDDARGDYRAFLQSRYPTIDALNRAYGTAYVSYDLVPLFQDQFGTEAIRRDWQHFLDGSYRDPATGRVLTPGLEHLRVFGPEEWFREHLRENYGDLQTLNRQLDTAFNHWNELTPPQRAWHYLAFEQHKGWFRWEFVRRNFLTVLDEVVLRGRAVFNTVVYCILAVLAALIVNPLAAYALSRYKPPSAYKVLLFLMLTMAFPPMVTQIPVFLLMREINILNTFWALILPGMANGYAIFLLKGFFDSLPHELYESAEIDGAGEIRIFLQITMSLSKPILAVIALDAFTLAYSNFMAALLVCQDTKMWTLMPWLYQLQQRSGPGVIYASLLIAAIPTFTVFALCQNVIMRGIVVPVEK